MYRIAVARPGDLASLPAIELAAAALLEGRAPASVLAETTSIAALDDARRHGRLWVALSDDVPVGFAHVVVLEPGAAHLEEIDVHPEHGRRGLGTWLVAAVCHWAATNGYAGVTLRTFRDVPWNMPFYARMGFEEIPSRDLSAAMQSVIDDEIRRGLDPGRRVAMRRPCVPDRRSDMRSSSVHAARGRRYRSMRTPELVISADPAPAEVQYLEDRIYEFNSAATGITDGQWLAILMRDDDDRIVAGICGNTWGGCAEIRQFWVDEPQRGQGWGTRLLAAAEQEARRRGCRQIVLSTFSFQAPAFYAKHGFEVVCVLEHHPSGHRNLVMRKRLGAIG
jgi:GNAT superfamily N-acetyltransferase